MRKFFIFMVILMPVMAGCAAQSPISPGLGSEAIQTPIPPPSENPHHIWWQGNLFFNAAHDQVDAVPSRDMNLHLNTLKFLESNCANCLKIIGIKNNGDSTIDLTVRVWHPFAGHPEYTGFDVKGIIMFNGSWERDWYFEDPIPYQFPIRIAWRKLGDAQVLNADGYSLRWNTQWDSGSPLPMFNYWKGKYSIGDPNGTLDAFINFYTNENRHIFETGKYVTKTYHIWLPPGQPVVAGYAVDACWEPPTRTPVTNPETDFPISANQAEAYDFRVNVNSGQPITNPKCCGEQGDPSQGYIFAKWWNKPPLVAYYELDNRFAHVSPEVISPCGGEWPDEYCGGLVAAQWGDPWPEGDFLGFGVFENLDENHQTPLGWDAVAFTIFEFTVDLK
jgi:hypothetical protein